MEQEESQFVGSITEPESSSKQMMKQTKDAAGEAEQKLIGKSERLKEIEVRCWADRACRNRFTETCRLSPIASSLQM